MSENKAGTQAEGHHHPEIEIERIETVSSTTTPWMVRLIFGVLGLVFIGAAVAAWEFRALFNDHISQALPYVIIGLGVLGVGAIVESITTEIWLALIAGVVALAVTFLIVGRAQIYPSQGSSVFVVDRFTAAVQFCTPDGCKPLPQVKDLPKPPAPVPLPALSVPAAAVVPPPLPLPPPVTAPAPTNAPIKAPAKK